MDRITNENLRSSPFDAPTPQTGEILAWTNLNGCGSALAVASAVARDRRLHVVLTPDAQTALRWQNELEFFLDGTAPVLSFPDWETLPYDVFSPLPEIVSERLRALSLLPQMERGILVAPVATIMQRLAPRAHILAHTFALRINSRLRLEEVRRNLEQVGYQCVSQVLQHGEFAIRGSILDIFPMGSQVPYRIELFDDDVESIRTFDTETQLSLTRVEQINLFPAREFPFTEESIKQFRRAFRGQFPHAAQRNPLYLDVSKGFAPGGIEYYLPLFVEHTETLFDYLPPHAVLVLPEALAASATAFDQEVSARFEQHRHDMDRPPLAPELLYLRPDDLVARMESYARIQLLGEACPGSPVLQRVVHFNCPPLPDLALELKHRQPAPALLGFLERLAGKTLFVAETPGRREALLDSLRKFGLRPHRLERWRDFQASLEPLSILVAPLDEGVWIEEPALAVITESQLTQEKVQQRRRRRSSASRNLENVLRNLDELTIGSPVVHQEHGVGRYLGLQHLNVGGVDAEFLMLEYANQDKLYVPVSSLHLISQYTGASAEVAPLHRLGNDQWQKAKRRAMERVRDVAAELLDIYARRAAKQGYAYRTIGEDYAAFASAFPFEETPDQEAAIQDVIADMASPQPMDRVICGDVGFGKTEVAMRAAFIAAQNGKQVAVLVPTTLLAQQHFQSFRDRFADWPIRIEVVSRFIGKKQQDRVSDDLRRGKIDILIGTHRLLQKDIQFKNLGLIVLDEEHRFGVSQKEHFKKLRAELDILSLTATPIPRTLNMAMAALRDISIIATPPSNRHAIKTFVTQWNDALVQEAILREIRRGGQAYFVHNKIDTMEKAARQLASLVPEARIRIAHGQMPERELEFIMLDFYHQRFNVLLCTTIIESGIDVPSANTILIDRADQLGLAQLHQLRGRVGRSHHRAYAYLLAPPKNLLRREAAKRLEAVEAAGELGAGFMLSSHDLEIRGAGELLGDEQSGQIQEIGFSLYTELLERAVSALKSGRQPELDASVDAGAEIDLNCPALIPDDYLPDIHSRLVLYKRIANARDAGELRELQVEMIDRFGLLPDAAKNLFSLSEIKLKAAGIGISKIEVGASGGRILFREQPNIDPLRVIQLIQSKPHTYKLEGPHKLRFTQEFATARTRIEFTEHLIATLAQ
jgi:transcription-repair coupling factor (superfamily II helicase)